MFWRDHAPPHFHALYAEHEAQIDIRSLEVIEAACQDAHWRWCWSGRPSIGRTIGGLGVMQPDADAKEDHAAHLAPEVVPKAPWRVAHVEVLPGFRLRVRFSDDVKGVVEMAEFVNSPDAGVFAVLRNENRFREARVVLGVVTWPGELDIAPDAMHSALKVHGIWIVK